MSLIIQKWFDEDLDAPAASGAFSLNLEPGSYTIAGAAATLAADRLFNAETGSYIITGIAAELLHGFTANAEAGSYAITGAAAELLKGSAINVEPGAYAVTGISASLLRGAMLEVQPGSYVITGFDATLEHTTAGAFQLVLDPGSYSLTGFDTTLEYVPQPQPETRPMGFYGVSFRKRRRHDDDEETVEVAVETSHEADKAQVAAFVAASLESAGVQARDVAGLLAKAEGIERLRTALEGLAPQEEPFEEPVEELVEDQEEVARKAVESQELSRFLEEFLRPEPYKFGMRERDFDTYLITLLVNEL